MKVFTHGRAAAVLALVFSSALAACGGSEPPPAPPSVPQNPPMKDPSLAAFDEEPASGAPAPAAPAPAPAAAEPAKLTTKIESKSGSKLTGTATLTETGNGVKIVLEVEGAGAAGARGAHIHEKGDCSSPDGKSAGDHFNPEKHDHALPAAKPQRHLGDLGNIEIGKDGKGTLTIDVPGANLKAGDPKSFRGRAIIVHEKKDDGGQPTGNAGGRHGCAVIPS